MWTQRPLSSKTLATIALQLINIIYKWNLKPPQELQNLRSEVSHDPVKVLSEVANIIKSLRITSLY